MVTSLTTQQKLDAALGDIGFARTGDRYVHPETQFWVEFPRGPLAVGGDDKIRPTTLRDKAGRASTLSATDSCRDRLAAFYHWNDRQSLDVAVHIARRQKVNLKKIRQWSELEAHLDQFEEFRRRILKRG